METGLLVNTILWVPKVRDDQLLLRPSCLCVYMDNPTVPCLSPTQRLLQWRRERRKGKRKHEKWGSAGRGLSPFLFPSHCPPRAFVSILPRLCALTCNLSPFPSQYEKVKEVSAESSLWMVLSFEKVQLIFEAEGEYCIIFQAWFFQFLQECHSLSSSVTRRCSKCFSLAHRPQLFLHFSYFGNASTPSPQK